MTMSRKTKADHEKALKGGKLPTFNSPTLIQRLGRRVMTTEDYREHRMGRRPHGSQPAEAVREGKATKHIRQMRAAGRTRTDWV